MTLPEFHLRDLFWLVLACAFAIGWWVERQRSHHAEAAVEQFDGINAALNEAQIDWTSNSDGTVTLFGKGLKRPEDSPFWDDPLPPMQGVP